MIRWPGEVQSCATSSQPYGSRSRRLAAHAESCWTHWGTDASTPHHAVEDHCVARLPPLPDAAQQGRRRRTRRTEPGLRLVRSTCWYTKAKSTSRIACDEYGRQGKSVFEVPAQTSDEQESFAAWVARVGNPMADGHDVVFQMPFVHDGIRGIADFLVRAVDPDTGERSLRAGRRQARPATRPSRATCCSCASTPRRSPRSPVSIPSGCTSGSAQAVGDDPVDDVLPYWRRLRGQLARLVDAGPTAIDRPRAVRTASSASS